MKVYDIQTGYNYGQTSCVVASSMGEAEKLFKKEYPTTQIIEIRVHAVYVIVSPDAIEKTEKVTE